MAIPLIATLLPALLQAAQGQQQQQGSAMDKVVQNMRTPIQLPQRPAWGGGFRGPMMNRGQ